MLASELLGYPSDSRLLIINADDFGMYPSLNNAVLQSIENGRSQIEAVLTTGLTPTHLDWHCLADGGREDIFDFGLALADEYRLAARVWLEHGRRAARQRNLPVVDHEFLDSFSLGVERRRTATGNCCTTCRQG